MSTDELGQVEKLLKAPCRKVGQDLAGHALRRVGIFHPRNLAAIQMTSRETELTLQERLLDVLLLVEMLLYCHPLISEFLREAGVVPPSQ